MKKKKKQKKSKPATFKLPKIGEKIYVPTSLYLSRGRDDFQGGLCTISRVECSKTLPEDHCNYCFVGVKEGSRSTSHNYKCLMEQQSKLRKEFGKRKGYKDPDMSASSNDDNEGWSVGVGIGDWD